MDIEDLNSLEQLDVIRKRKKYIQRYDPFALSDGDFKSKYQFSKGYARLIANVVEEYLHKNTRGAALTSELQVLVALRIWARNEIQDDTADIHGIGQQSVINICHRVATALARRAREYIKMPTTHQEQQEIMIQFRNICGFRNVIGAIDCTQIRIKKVPGEVSQYYINRKGYYSINVQIICDASLRIRDIVAHWRGSTHGSRIFRESRIRQ
ncbi:hypothetical protein C0J52_22719 [Blattella germanica]|nr:hypothetical protein C0J52_22719 [Blattella germanica]